MERQLCAKNKGTKEISWKILNFKPASERGMETPQKSIIPGIWSIKIFMKQFTETKIFGSEIVEKPKS